jgi:hypothetical protein
MVPFMGFKTSGIVAAAASGLLVVSAVGAPAALAYPPHHRAEVFTNKYKYKPDEKVKAKGVNVQPGCKVKFTYQGYSFEKVKNTTANSKGVAKTRLKHGPKKEGKYKVIINVSGTGCARETDKVTFKVKS